jgi:RNA polymerase sigma-70 factor (ECF subfamily)
MRRRFRDELDGTAGPWLYTIARNTLLMSVRRARVEQQACRRLRLMLPAATDAHGRPTAAPASEPGPSERWLDGLDEALDALPAAQREALRLRVGVG